MGILTSLGVLSSGAINTQVLTFDKFGAVEIVRQSAEPKMMVFLIYSDPDWKRKGERIATSIAQDGNTAVLINLEAYGKYSSEATFCLNIVNDLDELNKTIQQKLALSHPVPLVLLGKDRGANAVELAFSQTGSETFNGFMAIVPCKNAMSYNLCKIDHPLPSAAVFEPFSCGTGIGKQENTLTEVMKAHRSLRLQSWVESIKDRIYLQAPVSQGADNQISSIEVFPQLTKTDHLVVIYSGDGGWARFIRGMADRFAADGTPVIGVDSLRYFWKKKTPAEAARDLNLILEKYSQRFHVHKVHLVGFSFGADVLPFIYQNLPKERQSEIERISLLSLGKYAEFEFHLDNWISNESPGLPISPEITKLSRLRVDCAYGEEASNESLCPEINEPFVQVLRFPGGHFLNWDTEGLYQKIAH